MSDTSWKLLQIEPTREEEDIRRAYARRLREFRPDEDPEGFQRLVRARDIALAFAEAQQAYARDEQRTELHSEMAENTEVTPSAEVDEVQKPEAQAELHAADGTDDELASFGQRVETVGHEDLLKDPQAATEPTEDRIEAIAPATASPRDLNQLIFGRLDEIVARGERRPWGSLDPSDLDSRLWVDLFNQAAANLDLQQYEHFLETAGRFAASMLPAEHLREHETLDDFAQGRGLSAIVEVIEQHARFAERPARLVQLCGQTSAMRYFSWVAHAQFARGIQDRRSRGYEAYFNETTGFPSFPIEDKAAALETVEQQKFFEQSVERRRWSDSFDWKTLLLPGTRSATAGLIWQSGAFFLLLVLCVLAGFSINNYVAQMTCLVCLVILLGARIFMATRVNRLAVGASIMRVMAADRHGFWYRKRRNQFLRNAWRDFEKPIFITEMVLSILLVAVVPITIKVLSQTTDIQAKPVEAVLSEVVASSLEGVANDDRIPEGLLFELLKQVIATERTDFKGRGEGNDILVRDLPDRQWLNNLRGRDDELLDKDWLRASDRIIGRTVMATPAAERENKLHKLAAAYLNGTPAQRMQIEKLLTAWAPMIQKAAGPLAIAAVWAAVPPRTNNANLEAFPEELRRQLLDKFLTDAIENPTAADPELVTRFTWLLTASNDELGNLAPTIMAAANLAGIDDNPLAGGSNVPDGLPDQTKEDRSFAAQQSDDPDRNAARLRTLPSTNTSIARSAYFNIARTCLDLSKVEDRARMRAYFAQNLSGSLPGASSVTTERWRMLGQVAMGDPLCYRKVFAAGRFPAPVGQESRIDHQFETAEEQIARLPKSELSADEKAQLEDFVEFKPLNLTYNFSWNRLVARVHGLIGIQYYNGGDYRAAILELDQALAGSSNCKEFFMRRGQALKAIGDQKRAKADLEMITNPSTSQWCMTGPIEADALKKALAPLLTE